MKLESFKFQDGKIFWLPEYPEKPITCVWDSIEVAPEDVNDFKLLWERTYRGVPMSGEVYSVECEMDIGKQGICCSPMEGGINHHGYCDECPNYTERQVARLKSKDEIFPAANSHDMKDEDL